MRAEPGAVVTGSFPRNGGRPNVAASPPWLSPRIGAIVLEGHVHPDALMLELTEEVACENPAAVKAVLMQLRAMGIRISIDDFGPGYRCAAAIDWHD
jgi:EAL domain-containing protein (putative c-di-GMP-specific phosphodiesterase class I)